MNPDNQTIVKPKPSPPSRSWWACSREEFAARAKEEAARMSRNGFVLYDRNPKPKADD